MNENYAMEDTRSPGLVRESVLDALHRRQKHLAEEIAIVNEALAALEGNPDVARVLELVSRAARI